MLETVNTHKDRCGQVGTWVLHLIQTSFSDEITLALMKHSSSHDTFSVSHTGKWVCVRSVINMLHLWFIWTQTHRGGWHLHSSNMPETFLMNESVSARHCAVSSDMFGENRFWFWSLPKHSDHTPDDYTVTAVHSHCTWLQHGSNTGVSLLLRKKKENNRRISQML